MKLENIVAKEEIACFQKATEASESIYLRESVNQINLPTKISYFKFIIQSCFMSAYNLINYQYLYQEIIKPLLPHTYICFLTPLQQTAF